MQWEKKTNIDQLRFLTNPAAGHFWSDGISYTKAEDLHIMHVINQCAQRTLQQCAISAYYNRTHILLFLYKFQSADHVTALHAVAAH